VLKRLACAFTGPSGSGKTTLIEKITQILTPKYRVCFIKHDPKGKAIFDTPGKDSYRFFHAGADVITISPDKTVHQSHDTYESDFESIIKMAGDFDYLFIEGLKSWKLPRICIAREKVEEHYLECSQALAVDFGYETSQKLEQLDLNNPNEIIAWIDQHGLMC